MTTTMAHEMATRRTGRVGRPFTAAEDDTLRRLAAEGHTRRQIADAMGRQYWTIHTRAQ
jgi:DNA-binding CsgD family transcriptional regulator